MSLRVFIAHTGESFTAEPLSFPSIDALRSWIQSESRIPPGNQILMTSRGKQVKLQTLLGEREIYVYDRLLISPSSASSQSSHSRRTSLPPPFVPKAAPDTIASQNDIREWQNLFKARTAWATDLRARCTTMAELAQRRYDQVAVIEKAVEVAVTNLDTHVGTMEQKNADAQSWAEAVVQEHEATTSGWPVTSQNWDRIPVKASLLKLLSLRGSKSRYTAQQHSDSAPMLSAILDAKEIQDAISSASQASQKFASRAEDINEAVSDVVANTRELIQSINHQTSESASQVREEATRLLEDLDAVEKKIKSDYEHVKSLSSSSRAIPQVSKMALLHTRDLLPSLSERSLEMDQLQKRAAEEKNTATQNAIQCLQRISALESELGNVNGQISSIEVGSDGLAAFELLTSASRLPVTYGSLLIESVRRREWSAMIKADAANLAEELAAFKADEDRRRKKWHRAIRDFIDADFADGVAPGVEVTLEAEKVWWPTVERADIDAYLKMLEGLDGMNDMARDIHQMLNEFNRPARQQWKQLRAFKHGSLHEAAMGKSSLFLRGDDASAKNLREEKSKLEDKLKGSESRVRKLEDLLHRQSHVSRTISTNGFQPLQNRGQEYQATSPLGQQTFPVLPRPHDTLSRQSSTSSRRFSSNKSEEDRVLAQRIVSLEAQLIAERDNSAGLRNETYARQEATKDIQSRNDELSSTNRDLMDNLDAQQQEFVTERRFLENEISKLKLKVEEADDELERMLGSRDNEKIETDERLHRLEAELERTRKDAIDEIQKLRTESTSLRSTLGVEQQRTSDLVNEKDESSAAVKVLQERVSLLEQKLDHSEDALAQARADNDVLQSKNDKLNSDLNIMRDRVGVKDVETLDLRRALAVEERKASTLRTEIEEERKRLGNIRTKILDDESGVPSLKLQLEETERRAKESEENLDKMREDLKTQQEMIVARLTSRSSKARELSQQLYSQTDQLTRVIQLLGFAVSMRDGSTSFQRVSRSTTNSNETDPSASMSRSISGLVQSTRGIADSGELDLLDWMHSDDSDVEARKYLSFKQATGRFDVEAFGEAITKRVKEVEHLARKWQREARSYRDKAHRYHAEAHDKIAFRAFKEGDLALFLPTRNQATRPWAAFNVGAPHYFLREQDSHKLRSRDWLVARITKMEERMVDLSKSMNIPVRQAGDRQSIGESSDGASFDDENPFELSDGLRWYLLDAAEEKPGAPSTPGLGKSTVASAHVDATGSIRMKKPSSGNGLSKTLSRSLDSRRSSTNSKKDAHPAVPNSPGLAVSPRGSRTSISAAAPPEPDQTAIKADVIAANESPAVEAQPTLGERAAGERSATDTLRNLPKPTEKQAAGLWGSLRSIDRSLLGGPHGS